MDWLAVVKTVAPWIGTALGGPLGGMAVEAAAASLGLSEKTAEAVKGAIGGASPEQMLALKTADQQFQKDMQALGFSHLEKIEALAVEDRKDARAMQVAVRSRVPGALAIFITIGFFGILIGLLRNDLTTRNNDALLLLLGSLGTAWTGIVAYYFGSSAGSARKDELAAGAVDPVKPKLPKP